MTPRKKVLIACGTAIATATLVAAKVQEIAKEAGVSVDVVQCKAAEVRGRIATFQPHIIVATTPVPKDLGIPVFNGVPFLSGIGMDELKRELMEALQKA